MELIIVTIVMGVIMSIAIPKFTKTSEMTKSTEGVKILEALWKGQEAYKLENGDYTADLNMIDVDLPSAPKYFNAPIADFTCGQVGSIERQGSLYTLYVDINGNFTCGDGGSGICAQTALDPYPC